MKKFFLQISLLIAAVLIIAGCACHGCANPEVRQANATMLSSPFHNVTVINYYRHSPGCYLGCYSGSNLKGLIRVNGLYLGKTCQAQGHYYENISNQPNFTKLCGQYFGGCANNACTVDGATGSWLGIH